MVETLDPGSKIDDYSTDVEENIPEQSIRSGDKLQIPRNCLPHFQPVMTNFSQAIPQIPVHQFPQSTPGSSKRILPGQISEDLQYDSDNEGSRKIMRRKVRIEYIEDKGRRHITFSKRKAGIMKKAYELSTLTGTQVLLLVASETGHVYTFATQKLQPLITKPEGKNLIQACLNAPDPEPDSKEVLEADEKERAISMKTLQTPIYPFPAPYAVVNANQYLDGAGYPPYQSEYTTPSTSKE